MNRLDRIFERFVRDAAFGRANRPSRERPETSEPGERVSVSRRHHAVSYVLAGLLPAGVAALLVPFRADHPQTIALVLVVPVVVVAARGATGPALMAAMVAGVAYDVLLTEPYYQLVIDDPDDVIAAITLVAVAITVGLLSSRLVHLRARDTARHGELAHLLAFVQATASGRTPAELADDAAEHIAGVLDLHECRWHPGYHGGAGPTLYPDGSVVGFISTLNRDRAKLPQDLELPALAQGQELGRFILIPRAGGRITSHEERLTAATIAQLFATTAVSSTTRSRTPTTSTVPDEERGG